MYYYLSNSHIIHFGRYFLLLLVSLEDYNSIIEGNKKPYKILLFINNDVKYHLDL